MDRDSSDTVRKSNTTRIWTTTDHNDKKCNNNYYTFYFPKTDCAVLPSGALVSKPILPGGSLSKKKQTNVSRSLNHIRGYYA